METNYLTSSRLWNYQHPDNKSAYIQFFMSIPGFVEPGLYNQSGHEIRLLDEGIKNTGRHIVEWSPGKLFSGMRY